MKYAERDIEPSLRIFRSNRADTARILDRNHSISDESLTICWPKDGEQIVTVGEVAVMQSDHVDHHIAMIKRILDAGD